MQHFILPYNSLTFKNNSSLGKKLPEQHRSYFPCMKKKSVLVSQPNKIRPTKDLPCPHPPSNPSPHPIIKRSNLHCMPPKLKYRARHVKCEKSRHSLFYLRHQKVTISPHMPPVARQYTDDGFLFVFCNLGTKTRCGLPKRLSSSL